MSYHKIYFKRRPTILVQTVVNTTILIELKGIKIAATTGANCPVTAKYRPTTLYINESKKLHLIIVIPDFEALIY